MKKNILLVQSLLVLPLLSSYTLLSMDYKAAAERGLVERQSSSDAIQKSKKQQKRAARKEKARQQRAALTASAETLKDMGSSSESSKTDSDIAQPFAENIATEQLEAIIQAEQDTMTSQARDNLAAAADQILQLNNREEIKDLVRKTPALQTLLELSASVKTDIATTETQTVTAVEPIQTSTPEALQQEAVVTNDAMLDLGKSVLLPTQEKGLGWNWFRSPFSSHRTQVISILKNKTFEIDNKSYFDLLNNAVQEAIDQKDVESLLTIADLCQQDEYKKTIRIDDEKAQAASAFLSQTYTQHIDLANTEIQKAEERNTWAYNTATLALITGLEKEICKYRDNVNRFGESYNTTVLEKQKTATDLKERLKIFAQLNSGMKKGLTDLVWVKTIDTPEENPILKQLDKSEWRLQSVLRTGKIPTIETEQKSAILQIDNK